MDKQVKTKTPNQGTTPKGLVSSKTWN